ncbi:hypothetical protein D3C73_1313500 [compost metagenome]
MVALTAVGRLEDERLIQAIDAARDLDDHVVAPIVIPNKGLGAGQGLDGPGGAAGIAVIAAGRDMDHCLRRGGVR